MATFWSEVSKYSAKKINMLHTFLVTQHASVIQFWALHRERETKSFLGAVVGKWNWFKRLRCFIDLISCFTGWLYTILYASSVVGFIIKNCIAHFLPVTSWFLSKREDDVKGHENMLGCKFVYFTHSSSKLDSKLLLILILHSKTEKAMGH